jgi:mRNA interferase ChpB
MGQQSRCGWRTAMKRGDIYLVSLDPTLGREQQGSRPIVIVSATEFNQATKLPVVCPITGGGDFARRLGFAVPISGIETMGIVRCDQPRVLDLSARNARKIDTLPKPILEEVLAKLVTIFE